MSVVKAADGGAVESGPGPWMTSAPAQPGLATEAVYIYAVLRDGAGQLSTVTRRLAVEGGSGLRRLLLRSVSVATGLLEPNAAGRAAASSRDVHLDVDGDKLVARSADDASALCTASVDADELRWSEADVLRLTGSTCGPGLWWAIPGMQYAGWMYRVSGRFLGQEMTGIAGVDQVRLRAGAVLYLDYPLLTAGEPAIWTTFATAFADGGAEYGHALVARDGQGFAVMADDGAVTCTHEVHGTAQPDAAAADLSIGGARWTYRADPAGLVPATPGDPMVRSEGRLWRPDTKRLPSAHLAAMELTT